MFSLHLSRSTWALVLMALVLGGVVYGVERVIPQFQSRQDMTRSRLFPDFDAAQVRRILITTPDQRIVFTYSPAQDRWRMTEPEQAIANRATLEFLTNTLKDARTTQQIEVKPKNLPEYGLDDPRAAITVEYRDDPKPTVLVLGQLSFDEKSVYIYRRTDDPFQDREDQDSEEPPKPPSSFTVLLAPIELRYAIDRDLGEWIERDRSDL